MKDIQLKPFFNINLNSELKDINTKAFKNFDLERF